MAILPVSVTTEVAASRFFPNSLSRTLRCWAEELSRAFAATRRCEELRIGHAIDLPLRDRGSRARQVFVDIYSRQ